MAAITTEPCFTTSPSTDIGFRAGSIVASVSTSTSTFPPSPRTGDARSDGDRAPAVAEGRHERPPDSGERHAVCGRFGPATDGSTAARFELHDLGDRGSGRHRPEHPCSFVVALDQIDHVCPAGEREIRRVSRSTGKYAERCSVFGTHVRSVARVGQRRDDSPSPKNSTKVPTTPCARSICVSDRTRSVAVVPAGSAPTTRTPRTSGCGRKIG
jgi:hypothetical protein